MQRCNYKLKTIPLLVVALTLQGCGSLKPVCPPKKGSQSNKQVISSDPPTIAPYKVIGSRPQQPSIASVKEALKNASGNSNTNAAIGALRAQALRETALSLGARGGLAERALQINNTLLNYEPLLDRVFQFNGML